MEFANENAESGNEFDTDDTNNLEPKKAVLSNALSGLSDIENYIRQLSDSPESILDLLAKLNGELVSHAEKNKKQSTLAGFGFVINKK